MAMSAEQQSLHVCIICRFPAELDDAVVPTSAGRCICLRCFGRETESVKVVDRRFREELIEVLNAEELAHSA
jgi:hypothetical protein